MSIFSRRSVKTGLATAGLAAVLTTVVPATASADIVDDALNRLPAGQISCEQAESYWTDEDHYNSIRFQAQAAAAFHPRGGEIRDALNRVEEAANRCGLKGGGHQAAAANNPAPVNNQGNNSPAPSQPANNQGNHSPAPVGEVVTFPVAPGTPTFNLPVGNVATLVLPDLLQIVADFLNQFGITLPALPR